MATLATLSAQIDRVVYTSVAYYSEEILEFLLGEFESFSCCVHLRTCLCHSYIESRLSDTESVVLESVYKFSLKSQFYNSNQWNYPQESLCRLATAHP